MLFPEVADVLRSGLPETLRDTVWGVTRTLHRASRRAIQIEEELTYLGLQPESGRARIDELLRELIGALVGGRADCQLGQSCSSAAARGRADYGVCVDS